VNRPGGCLLVVNCLYVQWGNAMMLAIDTEKFSSAGVYKTCESFLLEGVLIYN